MRVESAKTAEYPFAGATVNFEKICVVGLGYIGLPTASTFAAHGIRVVGVDVNATILNTLQSGQLHIVEPGLKELFDQAVSSGNLTFQSVPEQADAFIIAVPTPFKEEKKADMRFVVSAAESLVPHLLPGVLVVLESTSPPRTTCDLLVPILERSGLKAGRDFQVAYSPERVLPGQIIRELVENARVIGGIDPASAQAGRDLYATFVKGEIVQTDATTAEMVKLMENTYRDINIAIANEFARLADRFGVDVWEAISIASRHPRVKILNPGPGVGGHCISVDPWFFVEAAPDISELIHTARVVNDTQPHFVVDWICRQVGDLKGKRVLALGLSYKPDVDDFRESPAVETALLLQQAGAQVKAYDPYAGKFKPEGLELASELEGEITSTDVILLLVGHREFKVIDPVLLARFNKNLICFDTVNLWRSPAWAACGLKVYHLGNGIERGK
jgi:UDP-N-acetyl-D-mannosaminuronic acid dehydrogenase